LRGVSTGIPNDLITRCRRKGASGGALFHCSID